MGARYPWYLLADSPEGQRKEAEITQRTPSEAPTGGDIRQGFVYERVPHITLKSIANNAEIDVIWEQWQETLEPLRAQLNAALGEAWEEWEIPRESSEGWSADDEAAHAEWWEGRVARQREIDASIAGKADHEYLYDKPYTDNARIRVARPPSRWRAWPRIGCWRWTRTTSSSRGLPTRSSATARQQISPKWSWRT